MPKVQAYVRGAGQKYLIVGECLTISDETKGEAFRSAGARMLDQMLLQAGINPKDCVYTNVVNQVSPDKDMRGFLHKTASPEAKESQPTKGLYPKQALLNGLDMLERLIDVVRPELIIALGNYALWALTEGLVKIDNSKKPAGWKVPTGIVSYRGSHLYHTRTQTPLLPTFHPVAALRNPAWYYQMRHDLRTRVKILQEGAWTEPEKTFTIRPSYKKTIDQLLSLLLTADQQSLPLSVDIETRSNYMSCIGLAWNAREAICIPWMCVERDEGYWNFEEEATIVALLKKLFLHKNVQLIGQNFLFDAQFIWDHWFIRTPIAYDTMIAQHLLYPGTELNLVMLSSLYCRHHRYWKEDRKFFEHGKGEETLWEYNCRDTTLTYEIWQEQKELVASEKLTEQFGFQMRQVNVILLIMLRGVCIDLEAKHVMKYELEARIDEYAKRLETLLPEGIYEAKPKAAVWYNSTQQQKEIFTEIFQLRPFWNKQKRGYTMDSAALDHYIKEEPILKLLCTTLQQYASLRTFRTFTNMRLSADNRMRCTFSPTAKTFRWKSSTNAFGSGGNLQNLPKGQEE